MRNEICTLVGLTSDREKVEPVEEEVYCTRKSSARTEFYSAYAVGLKPRFILEIDPMDWEMMADRLPGPDEPTMVRHGGNDYNILRSYQVDEGRMELTVG